MKRWITASTIVALLSTAVGSAQVLNPFTSNGSDNPSTTSTTTTTTPALADQTPSENVTGASVRGRAPGLIISAARSRHTTLTGYREEFQSGGGTNGSSSNVPSTGGSSGSSTTGTDGLSGLLGGALGNIDINSLLGGLTGLTGKSTDAATSSLTDAKLGLQQQTATTQPAEDPFRVRWANAMLSTVFTSLTFAFQSSDFIGAIEDLLRPIIRPDLTNSSSNTSGNKSLSALINQRDEVESQDADTNANDDTNAPRFPKIHKIKHLIGGN